MHFSTCALQPLQHSSTKSRYKRPRLGIIIAFSRMMLHFCSTAFFICVCHIVSYLGCLLYGFCSSMAQYCSFFSNYVAFLSSMIVLILLSTFCIVQSQSSMTLNRSKYFFSTLSTILGQLFFDSHALNSGNILQNVLYIHSAIAKAITTIQKKSLQAQKFVASLLTFLRARTI